MHWRKDQSESEWAATIKTDGHVRVLRRTVKPPYREGGEETETFETFEFARHEAAAFANELLAAAGETKDPA
jgi:ribose 1,5-bisphosphokinase PhnN